jgi:uncharacterized protein YbbC (DUF1343 family)
LEFSGVSVGRGTEAPFQVLAAPWLDPEKLLASLPKVAETADISGEAIEVTPGHAVFAGELCRGVRFRCSREVPEWPVGFGLAVMAALKATHVELTDELWEKAGILVGSRRVLQALERGEIAAQLAEGRATAEIFRTRSSVARLYGASS